MIRNLMQDFLAVLRDGFRIWRLAPLIALLVVIPEAIQHIAEIRIGMFESRDMARAVADDPRRMVWGYLKVAGLVVAILAAARFWGTQLSPQRWWDLRSVAWRSVILALGLLLLISLPSLVYTPILGAAAAGYLDIALMLVTLPLLVLLIAGLIGDRALTLAGVFRTGWLAALRMLLFLVATWAPLAWLHGLNHRWAMGAIDPLVWLLMGFDSLVVGLLATMAGTAIHHGYASLNRERDEPRPVAAE